MTGMQEQWQKISENLRGVLNPGIFKVWIHPLDAHIEGNSLCLAAPSEYVARWLRDRTGAVRWRGAFAELNVGSVFA